MTQLQTIHEIRLSNARKLMEDSGLDRTEFAEKIQMSYNLLSQYIGKNPTKNIGDETAEKIEQAFNKPKGFLDQSQDNLSKSLPDHYIPPIIHDGLPASKQTPVISWVQAGDFTPVVSADMSHVIEWIPYNPRAGQYGFGLIVKGASMEPTFKPEDRIYVNPTFQLDELNTGDLVVMACDGDSEATFKELVVEDGDYYLRPINPNWHKQIIPIDCNCRLVGKVVGRYTIF
ncbi:MULTISPECIES: LexA family transcriptional regulator [unclassified Acinetobacter]|uniref:LexA family transcriptional regulator n=1 Tax=unclassified Acinetobacter TaxID=196816 RepID=UPI00244BBB24|nr:MULTISPECIES: LexA family transcriptional regulator [unclassified Acinetobacter]MDH0032041.1 LexA family transcriptional regulator [Acinetobacter sp. GD04021]MDH0887697.1 LexA family transcriptional regulator [Acinetobacter sp. GD03873]MDH1084045.1 LexA family transcriptional regulator [Acinetobacter sp. GD03983]MDH2191028.1 LexA family transcriptional regulator [Acinetobacter sp. GD03645]MDH2204557.1 LexA family transcriptional regulator [Acinetobacter sp. GD03647]